MPLTGRLLIDYWQIPVYCKTTYFRKYLHHIDYQSFNIQFPYSFPFFSAVFWWK